MEPQAVVQAGANSGPVRGAGQAHARDALSDIVSFVQSSKAESLDEIVDFLTRRDGASPSGRRDGRWANG